MAEALHWLTSVENLRSASVVGFNFRGNGLFAALLLIAIVLLRQPMWRRLSEIAERVSDPKRDGLRFSIEALVITGLLVALVTLVLVKNLPGVIEIMLQRRTTFDRGARFAFSTLVRYTITIIGTIAVFGLLGGCLVEIAEQHPAVLNDPAPHTLLLDFGDDAINFELRFVVDFGQGLTTKDQVQMSIDYAFREKGIEFALPKSEVRLISGTETGAEEK